MSLRAKTARRLTILLMIVVVFVAIGAGFYLRNERAKAARLAAARSAGLSAFKAGDYRAALDALKTYVSRQKSDPEALYAYGVSRSRLEEPNGRHISEGITVFSTLLQSDPNNLEAAHDLLDLYTQVYYSKEAIDLANRVLANHPDDARAMRAKCISLDRLRKYDDALPVSEKLNALDLTDMDQQLITYELMRKLRRPPADLLARALKQQMDHPDDPRFEMLLAIAYGNAGDLANGTKWLRTAASRTPPDAAFVRHMVRVLDSVKLYDESQAMLDRVTAQNPDADVMRVLVQRLWQNGRSDEVIERLKDIDPASASSDTGLLAYHALALHETGKKDDANKIVQALAQRSTDRDALAWSGALSARFAGTEPKQALAQYQAALVRSPRNAVIRFLVGESYFRLGETELAISAWRRSVELSPSWASPHIEIARTLAGNGRLKEAAAEAAAAVRAAPTQLQPAVVLAGIRHKLLQDAPNDSAERDKLLALVEQIQKSAPGEPETLPIYVNLLAQSGRREDAIAAARAVAKDPRRYDQATVLRLLAASRVNKLGLEDILADAASGTTDTPRLALVRAADLAASGKPDEGLESLQSRAKAATTQPAQWQLAIVQYREMLREPSAVKEWVALGDANPADLSIQTAILKNAASARSDRDFIARTIDRVKALTGPEGQTWKIERARWLISSDSSKDSAEAVNTLSDIVRASPTLTEPRLLLANAYENVGNAPAAIKELQAAAELEPANLIIALELSRQLQQSSRFADARTYLERAATTADLPADQRRHIAGMLAAQGDLARGAKVLESAGKDLDVPGQLLLADIYRRQNRPADAEAIYTKLLAAASPSADVIRIAADFYGSRRQVEQGQKLLAQLTETNPRPGAREIAQATFQERYVGLDAAQRSYLAATSTAPADATTWRAMILFYLRVGSYEEALHTATEALKKIPDDASLKRLNDETAALLQLLKENPSMKPALTAMASSADDRGVSDFLIGPRDPSTQPATQPFLPRLQSTATRWPRSLPLQSALLQWHLAMKQYADAGKVAARTMDAFPNDPESARVASMAYRLDGQLDLAAAAATKWRERSADKPEAADWMLADIRLAQNDADGAIKALGPYVAFLTIDPSANPQALETLLRAYAKAGREDESKTILEPLLVKDIRWRLLWLQLASGDIRNPQVASDWIKQAAALMSADAAEQIALANEWYALGVRTKDSAAIAAAAKIIDPIVQKPDASATAILLCAAIADQAGDPKTAEENYRRALKLNPDEPGGLNNLAYLILLRPGDLNEAKTLSSRAVALSPKNSTFRDTLARAQAKLGENEAAIAGFREAIELQPGNVEALIGLATALSSTDHRNAAVGLLSQIDTLLKANPPVSAHLQRELDALRAVLK